MSHAQIVQTNPAVVNTHSVFLPKNRRSGTYESGQSGDRTEPNFATLFSGRFF